MEPVQHFTFATADLVPTVAHDGRGAVDAVRVLDRTGTSAGGAAFLDLVVVPPAASIGRHRHGADEEIYVVVSGHGVMTVDGTAVAVGPGDVVVNRPGGEHALDNTGDEAIRLVVVDVAAHGAYDDR